MMPALHATCSAGSVSLAVNSETLDPTPTGATTLVGRVLSDRYRIENVVNVGANTVIAEAIDTDANRPVTVKIVRPELAVTSAFGQAFRRQIEVAMSLTHPNIATVLGWGQTELEGEPTLYWVVEYLGGGSLRDLFDRGRLLSPSQALVVGLEAARGLEAAHGRGIVHTELTPSKLVFGEDARLRITDFAMAQLLGAEPWTEPATVATHVARYASPEQALGLDVDEKTDVYALSLCLIESITGTVPFAGDSTVSTLAARIGKLMPVTADMGSLASVLERGGRPDSDDRWTASEFGRALVSAAEALPRPEPIPVLASSLFASSLAHRVEPTPIEPTPIEPAPIEPTPIEPAPIEPAPIEPPDVEVDGDESSLDAVVPLVLLTDVSDPPTGAVEVAADPDAGDAVAADPDEADDVPAESASAGEMATVVTAAVATEAVAPTAEMPALPLDPTPSGIIYDEEHPRRPWGKYILFGVIALVGIGLLSYAGWMLLRTKSFEVPDLTGVEEAVARNEVAGNGWVIETQRERSDEVPEIDHVVRTVPVAGERLDEGETFVIVVSDGFELRTLPELTGMTVSDAVDALIELRLVPTEAPAVFSEEVPAGSVIGWEVQDDAALTAGAQVLPDTVVVITPSLGPEPRPAPDLVNLTAAEATAALDALQLVTEQGKDVFSNDIEKGRVVTQTPDPGTPVERGGTVTFQLSKGPDLVPFPDLTGLAYPAAQAALADAGYTVNSLLGTTEGTFVSASVGGDEIQAGATFPRGTGVDLIFL
jgi:serine/threonine-protein kinase